MDLDVLGIEVRKMYNYFKDYENPWQTRADEKYVIIVGNLSGFNTEKKPMISSPLTSVMVVQ